MILLKIAALVLSSTITLAVVPPPFQGGPNSQKIWPPPPPPPKSKTDMEKPGVLSEADVNPPAPEPAPPREDEKVSINRAGENLDCTCRKSGRVQKAQGPTDPTHLNL